MIENEPCDFDKLEVSGIFVVDLNNPALKLRSLASTAKFLPMEYLDSWLEGFVSMEQYEEAAVIKKEIDNREPKYKFYLSAPDGTMTELKGLDYLDLPKFKP